MAIPAVDLAGALGAAPQAEPNGAGFDAALQNAAGGGAGGGDQMTEMMVTGGVQIMGDMMMRMANEMLGEAMSDE